jgi:hypothetical protein
VLESSSLAADGAHDSDGLQKCESAHERTREEESVQARPSSVQVTPGWWQQNEHHDNRVGSGFGTSGFGSGTFDSDAHLGSFEEGRQWDESLHERSFHCKSGFTSDASGFIASPVAPGFISPAPAGLGHAKRERVVLQNAGMIDLQAPAEDEPQHRPEEGGNASDEEQAHSESSEDDIYRRLADNFASATLWASSSGLRVAELESSDLGYTPDDEHADLAEADTVETCEDDVLRAALWKHSPCWGSCAGVEADRSGQEEGFARTWKAGTVSSVNEGFDDEAQCSGEGDSQAKQRIFSSVSLQNLSQKRLERLVQHVNNDTLQEDTFINTCASRRQRKQFQSAKMASDLHVPIVHDPLHVPTTQSGARPCGMRTPQSASTDNLASCREELSPRDNDSAFWSVLKQIRILRNIRISDSP